MRRPARTAVLRGRAPLEAIASPARQEVVSGLGEGPLTVRALAERLGRSRQALYYHLTALERAGLVRVVGFEGRGRDRERVYGVTADRIALGAAHGSAAELRAGERAARAILRLTTREVTTAIRTASYRQLGPTRELMVGRGKARLTQAELRRLNGLLDEVMELIAKAQSRPSRHRLYAVTVTLTPAREAGALPRAARRAAARETPP